MKTKREKILVGIVIFISVFSLCAIASAVGDHYFPMENYIETRPC